MGPRIFAALGDRGRPTICWLNTAGETGPFVSSSSFLELDSRYLDILEAGRRLKKSRFLEKSRETNGSIAFHQSSNYAKLIGDRSPTFLARGPNVKCPFPERRRRGTALCLAVVRVFGVWLLLEFSLVKLSHRVPPRINRWLRFLLISYLRLVLRLLRLFVETLVDRMCRCGIVAEYL